MRNRFIVIFALWGLLAAGPGMVEATADVMEKDITTSFRIAPEAVSSCYPVINRTKTPDLGGGRCKSGYGAYRWVATCYPVSSFTGTLDYVESPWVSKPNVSIIGPYTEVRCTWARPHMHRIWLERR